MCKHFLPISDFSPTKANKDGLAGICKPCNATAARKYWHKKTEVEKKRHNLRRYGITLEDYETLLVAQSGGCALCGGDFDSKGPNVDHDHETGLVRGLLCTNCNTALGKFSDSITMLRKAITYLSSFDLA